MTDHDLFNQFAMAALTGLCSSEPSEPIDNEFIAERAFNLARCMMERRQELNDVYEAEKTQFPHWFGKTGEY